MAKSEFLYGALLHLGENMWTDQPCPQPEDKNPRYPYPDYLKPDELAAKKLSHRLSGDCDYLRLDEDVWRRATDRMAELKMNFVMVDVGEALVYPSHPELAVKGSWSPEKLAAEVARLRGIGLEPVPKLNFSATHDAWLKEYSRMVSTPEYYRVVSDVIRDVAEIFKPRYFHIGYDEEDHWHQDRFLYAVMRKGDLWWHDFLFTVKEVENTGARAWMWSDKIWHARKEFVRRCPKSVLCSNWYYLDNFDPKKDSPLYPMVHAYEWLDEAGFDQVPCCSSCGNWSTLDTNPLLTVEYCLPRIARERFKGLLTTSWQKTMKPFERWIIKSLDLTIPAAKELSKAGLV